MNKKILEKITRGDILQCNDLTAEEKKSLYDLMESYDMSPSTTYFRVFRKGFLPWEVLGVTQLKNKFLLSMNFGCDKPGDEEAGSRGYAYVLTLDNNYDDSKFYQMLSDLKMGKRFCDFMAEHGMASQTTVRNRFRDNDWKDWELKGVRAILEPICQ